MEGRRGISFRCLHDGERINLRIRKTTEKIPPRFEETP